MGEVAEAEDFSGAPPPHVPLLVREREKGASAEISSHSLSCTENADRINAGAAKISIRNSALVSGEHGKEPPSVLIRQNKIDVIVQFSWFVVSQRLGNLDKALKKRLL